MKDLFRNTMLDIDTYSEILKSLCKHAIELGLDEEHLNVHNVHLKTDKALKQYIGLTSNAKELGYGSLPLALKALSQFKTTGTDLNDLPPVFHKVPKLWLVGRASTRQTPGFVPLTLRVAQREHKQTVPLLLEAWGLADETNRDAITNGYLTNSAENFKQLLYAFIFDNEETSLEDDLVDAIAKEVEQENLRDWQYTNSLKRNRAK